MAKVCRWTISQLIVIFFAVQSFGQPPGSWKLERMPAALETDFALSCLPLMYVPALLLFIDPEKVIM